MAGRRFFQLIQFLFTASRCHIHVLQYRDERTLAEFICHRHTGSSSGMMVLGVIRYTSRPPFVRTDRTFHRAFYVSGMLVTCLYLLFELCETLRFSRIIHGRILLVLYRPFLIRTLFGYALTCTFPISFANRKHLVHGC
ncbi:hypothetical protein TNCV_3131221 [Trichonephila clavipes]|nr:hypothetical protein TNCV_3131221 [Trichonephila clavipes]